MDKLVLTIIISTVLSAFGFFLWTYFRKRSYAIAVDRALNASASWLALQHVVLELDDETRIDLALAQLAIIKNSYSRNWSPQIAADLILTTILELESRSDAVGCNKKRADDIASDFVKSLNRSVMREEGQTEYLTWVQKEVGVDSEEMARILGTDLDTYKSWVDEVNPIPASVEDVISHLQSSRDDFVGGKD